MINDGLIVLVALVFILAFGGLPVLRREGLSLRLPVEVLIITALFLLASHTLQFRPDPILFLIIVYLLSMRVRILVDIGNILSERGQQVYAITLYRLALRLGPDPTAKAAALINHAVAFLRLRQPEKALPLLEETARLAEGDGIGLKHEAACYYNLGVTYRALNQEAKAVRAFNQVIDLLPNSPYARQAQTALKKKRKK